MDEYEAPIPLLSRTARLVTRLGRLAEVPTVLGGITTIGACGAAFAWPLEMFCHFRVQYALVLLILGATLAVARRPRWAGAAFVLFAINAWFIAPFLLPTGDNAPGLTAADGPHIKLVSINVYSGNPTPERVIEFLEDTNPDVIVALEVTPAWERRLKSIESTHPHFAVQSSTGNFGIALYSRVPLHDVKFVPLSEQNDAISARIEVAGQSWHIVAAHPFPPVGSRGSELRNRQLRQLARLAAQHDGPTIVAGDLNITPFSPWFDRLLADANLRDPRRGQGLLPTWPSHRWPLWIPIDHCLVNEGIAARLVVGPNAGSDHLPLIAELGFGATFPER